MEINDAFMAENIKRAHAEMGEEESQEVDLITQILFDARVGELLIEMHNSTGQEAKPLLASDVAEIWNELCRHSFMAGMTYAINQLESEYAPEIPVNMTPGMAQAFIQFLLER